MQQVPHVPSAKKLLFAISASIFLGEALIMMSLNLASTYSKLSVAIIDSALLLIISFPSIYYLAFRPLENQLLHTKKIKADLRRKIIELSDATELAIESERRYINLFDFAPVGYMVINDMGEICEINTTGTELLGLPKSMAIHRNLSSFLNDEELKHWNEFREKVLNSKTKLDCKLLVQRRDHSTFYALFECVCERESEEKTIRISFTDITKENFARYRISPTSIGPPSVLHSD